MPRSVRLYRPELYRELARIRRNKKWRHLSFCDFVIRAESILNPEHTNDPDDNFSVAEVVRGYIEPIPLNLRSADIRIFIDSLGRPDKYAIIYYQQQRIRWNETIENHHLQIYVITVPVQEIRARTTTLVNHHYVRVLRGRDAVRQIDARFDNGIEGYQEGKERIQPSTNVTQVDKAIEERLRWQEQQNGGP